jgi:hypothetical protein
LVDDGGIHGHIPRPTGNGDTDETNLWEESVTMMYFCFERLKRRRGCYSPRCGVLTF